MARSNGLMDVLIGGRLNTRAGAPLATGGEGALLNRKWVGATLSVKGYRPTQLRGNLAHRRAHAEFFVAHPPPRLRHAREGWEVA